MIKTIGLLLLVSSLAAAEEPWVEWRGFPLIPGAAVKDILAGTDRAGLRAERSPSPNAKTVNWIFTNAGNMEVLQVVALEGVAQVIIRTDWSGSITDPNGVHVLVASLKEIRNDTMLIHPSVAPNGSPATIYYLAGTKGIIVDEYQNKNRLQRRTISRVAMTDAWFQQHFFAKDREPLRID